MKHLPAFVFGLATAAVALAPTNPSPPPVQTTLAITLEADREFVDDMTWGSSTVTITNGDL